MFIIGISGYIAPSQMEAHCMGRPVTLFTGQWADLPLEILAEKAADFGYDGLELACWGDHFDVGRALSEDGYTDGRHELLAKFGLKCWSISNHLVGQAVCDRIDQRHQSILPVHIWGDGEAEGVRLKARLRQRCALRARIAAREGTNFSSASVHFRGGIARYVSGCRMSAGASRGGLDCRPAVLPALAAPAGLVCSHVA